MSYGAHFCGLPLSLDRRLTMWFIKSKTGFLYFNAYCWLAFCRNTHERMALTVLSAYALRDLLGSSR